MPEYKIPKELKKKALELKMKKAKFKGYKKIKEGETTYLKEGKPSSKASMEEREIKRKKLLPIKSKGTFYGGTLESRMKKYKK